MIFSSPEAFLVHVLRAFEPYLDRVVLVGGFAVIRDVASECSHTY